MAQQQAFRSAVPTEALRFLGFRAFCQIPSIFPAPCCVQTNPQCCVLPRQQLPTGFAFALLQGRAAALTPWAAAGGTVPVPRVPRGWGVRNSCSHRNPSCQHSVSFSKAPWPEARGWGREEISRCWLSSFSSHKGAVGLLLPVASVLVGIFSLQLPAGEPRSSQCLSLCFFFGNLSCFEQGSGAEGVCTFRASPPLPELVPSQTRGPRVPINPSPLNFLFLHPAARAGG